MMGVLTPPIRKTSRYLTLPSPAGHRGRKGDALYSARRTLHTGAELLTDRQHQRLSSPFATDEPVEVEAT